MALVLVTHLFLAKERLALRDSHRFLSCLDIVELLRQEFPSKMNSVDDLVHIAQRYRRQFQAAKRHYDQQGITPAASFGAPANLTK